MKKFLAALLAVMMVLSLCACATEAPAAAEGKELTDEDYAAWATEHGYVLNPEENGYMKMEEELATSATDKKSGGVNFGAIDWSEELQIAAVKEWLKGGPTVQDPNFAQDESGYSYRNMLQMATSYNNVPMNTNLELVLDADSLCLLGVSEAGTGKTLQFTANPAVSISWCKQLREADEEAGYNYYGSYGLTFQGDVKLYSPADLETEEGQNALISLFDKYYITCAQGWPAYYKCFAEATDDAAIREGKLSYITNVLNSGAYVVYEIVPSKIVITAPFMTCMSPTMNNAFTYTMVQEGDDKYAYDLDISDAFLDMAIAYKNSYLADSANQKTIEEYYATGMYPMLDEYCAQYGAPTSLECALLDNSCAGLKTQTTYTPAA